jgi:hypothetical protein
VDDRADADQVEAPLAGDREIVDVEDRELGPAAREQLRRVGGGGGLADRQPDAGVLVGAARLRRVDAGVDGVGLEVQDQGRLF